LLAHSGNLGRRLATLPHAFSWADRAIFHRGCGGTSMCMRGFSSRRARRARAVLAASAADVIDRAL
jgi:hypothetical protein